MTRILGSIFTAALAATAFSACSNDANTVAGPTGMILRSGTTTPAHPALVYTGGVVVAAHGHVTYTAIVVMDTDGTHQTSVYTSPTSAAVDYQNDCWSPSGGSVAWVENQHTIRAVDVTLNSS